MTRLFLTAYDPEPGQAFHSFRESVCVRLSVCGGAFASVCVCLSLSHMLIPKHQLRDPSQLKANAGPDALPLPTSGY